MRIRSVGLAAAPGVVVALVWFLLVVVPSGSAADDLDRRREILDGEVVSLAASLDDSRQLAGTMAAMQADLESLERAIPPTTDLAGVVRLIDVIADASGLSVDVVSPRASDASAADAGESTTSGSSFQVEVSGSATYSELIAFVEGLESTDRFVSITSLGLEGGQGSGRLAVTLTFEVFTSTPASPASAVEPTVLASDQVPANTGDAGATIEAVAE